jgi:hypothetical protein
MANAQSNVRERFSLEFVSAEGREFKKLLEGANVLPELVLFDPEIPTAVQEDVCPVQSLKDLFAAIPS